MIISAAVCREYGKPLQIEAVEREEPRADEIRVRIVAAGICHTDVSMINTPQRVPLPILLDHEGARVVERVGGVFTDLKPGDRVVLSYAYCGHCESCVQGLPFYCDHMQRLNFGESRWRAGVSESQTRSFSVFYRHSPQDMGFRHYVGYMTRT